MEQVNWVNVVNTLIKYILKEKGFDQGAKTIIELLEEEIGVIELVAMGFDYDMILKIKGDQQ
jgi:mannose/fructose/N-acetylgalactosamine-specific phosphotransferase system component IID